MRLVALALNLLIFCLCLQASAQEQKPITVRGKLVNIMGVAASAGFRLPANSAPRLICHAAVGVSNR